MIAAALTLCARAALSSEDALLKIATDSGSGIVARTRAFADLQAVASEQSIALLAPLLVDPTWSHAARRVLEPMPGAAADRALLAALVRSSEDAVRAGIVNSLGHRRTADATEAIRPLLSSTNAPLVDAALDALAGIATVDAADALLAQASTIKSKTIWADAALRAAETVRTKSAAKSAELYRAVKANGPPTQAAAAWMSLARASAHPSAEIVAALRSDDEQSRTAALAVIRAGEFGPKLTATVGEALASLSSRVQVQVLSVLHDRGDRGAAPFARRALRARDRDVSAAAARLLSVVGDASDAALLLPLMAGSEEPARFVRVALARLPGKNTTTLLVDAFRAGGDARTAALEVLVARGYRALLPELLRPEMFADDSFRPIAANAILVLGTGADLERVLAFHRSLPVAQRSALEAPLRRIAAKNLSPDAAAGIVFAAAEKLPLGEAAPLYTIVAGTGGEAARAALTNLLKSPALERRKAAARALGSWRDATPAGPLLEFAKSESDASAQSLAVRSATTLFTRSAFAGNAAAVPAEVPAAIAGLRATWRVAEQRADKNAVIAALRSLKTTEATTAAEELEKSMPDGQR